MTDLKRVDAHIDAHLDTSVAELGRLVAIPSVGGMVVSVLVTIYIAPCLFCAVEEWKWKRAQRVALNAIT